MKKLLALTLAAALALSLAACGGGNDTPSGGNDTQGTQQGDSNTTPEGTGMTKEEMLETAKTFDYSDFVSAFNNNELKAKDTYLEDTYKVSGFVRKVDEDSCILEILDAVSDDFVFKVGLPKEELIELNNGQRITVVGVIDNIDGRQISMNTAYYVDNIYEINATVLSNVYAKASDPKPSYCVVIISDTIDTTLVPFCMVYLSGDDLLTLKEEDKISVSGELYALSTNPLDGGLMVYDGKTILLEMKNAHFAN